MTAKIKEFDIWYIIKYNAKEKYSLILYCDSLFFTSVTNIKLIWLNSISISRR